jgi:hypothetical protein
MWSGRQNLQHDGRCNDWMKSHFYLQLSGMPHRLQEYPGLKFDVGYYRGASVAFFCARILQWFHVQEIKIEFRQADNVAATAG